ncbi:hypothetical protein C3L33_11514, partial [Rhododendron williamsianum]
MVVAVAREEGRSIRALEGKPIPTELKDEEAQLCREIDLEDKNCQYVAYPVSATSPDLAVKWLACPLGDTLPCVPISYLRQDLHRVKDLPSLGEFHAWTLLIHYRWDVEKLFAVLVEKA